VIELKIYFITTNEYKFKEACEIFQKFNLSLEMLKYPLPEIQGDTLIEVVIWKANEAFKIIDPPFIIEDTGLFINRLNGFPGVYSSYVYRTIGLEGILRLMQNIDDRSAYFEALGLVSIGKHVFKIFRKRVYGHISKRIRGEGGFGYDPIFIPEGEGRTFAEMNITEKNKISHRGGLFRDIANYLKLRMTRYK